MSLIVPSTLELFPECPTYGFTVQPQYLVKIVAREGGFERVDRRWSRPLNVYTAVPMGNRDEADIQSILYFWHAMGGRATKFRFKDWADYKSCPVQNDTAPTDQPFELVTLDDSSTGYRLIKVYQVGSLSQVREITQPMGSSISVKNNSGSIQHDWTLDEDTGILKPGDTFTGTPHSWGGEFYVPVRFDSELSVQTSDKQIETVDFTLTEKRISLSTTFDAGSGLSNSSPGSGEGSPGGGGTGPGGPTWTAQTQRDFTFPANQQGYASGYGNGNFLYISSQEAFLSPDSGLTDDEGLDWTSVLTFSDLGDGLTFEQLAYGGGYWIICGHDESFEAVVAISVDDGTTWNLVSVGTIGDFYAIATDTIGNWVTLQEGIAVLSPDSGTTWTPMSWDIGSGSFNVVMWDGTNFIACGTRTDGSGLLSVYESSDLGDTWTEHHMSTGLIEDDLTPTTIAFGNGIYVGGFYDDSHWYLKSGTSLTSFASSAPIDLELSDPDPEIGGFDIVTGIAFGSLEGTGKFEAISQNGVALESVDGITWLKGVSNFATSELLDGIEYDGTNAVSYDVGIGTFLAVGSGMGSVSTLT